MRLLEGSYTIRAWRISRSSEAAARGFADRVFARSRVVGCLQGFEELALCVQRPKSRRFTSEVWAERAQSRDSWDVITDLVAGHVTDQWMDARYPWTSCRRSA